MQDVSLALFSLEEVLTSEVLKKKGLSSWIFSHLWQFFGLILHLFQEENGQNNKFEEKNCPLKTRFDNAEAAFTLKYLWWWIALKK